MAEVEKPAEVAPGEVPSTEIKSKKKKKKKKVVEEEYVKRNSLVI